MQLGRQCCEEFGNVYTESDDEGWSLLSYLCDQKALTVLTKTAVKAAWKRAGRCRAFPQSHINVGKKAVFEWDLSAG